MSLDYSNSVIYKIYAINGKSNEIYYDATTRNKLSLIIGNFRYLYKKWISARNVKFHPVFYLFYKFGLKHVKIMRINCIKCKNKEELNEKKREFIENVNCLNHIGKKEIHNFILKKIASNGIRNGK